MELRLSKLSGYTVTTYNPWTFDNKYEIEQFSHIKATLITSQVSILCYETVMDIQVDA